MYMIFKYKKTLTVSPHETVMYHATRYSEIKLELPLCFMIHGVS